jgi:integrase
LRGPGTGHGAETSEGEAPSKRYFALYGPSSPRETPIICAELAGYFEDGDWDAGDLAASHAGPDGVLSEEELTQTASGRAALAQWRARNDSLFQDTVRAESDRMSSEWDEELERLRRMSPGQRAGWHLQNGSSLQEVAVMIPEFADGAGINLAELRQTCGACGRNSDPPMLHAVSAAVPEQPRDETGLNAWRRWRSWLAAQFTSDTVRNQAGNILRFLAETDCREPGSYTEGDLAAFLERCASRGIAKHEHLKSLRSFFGWCLRNGYTETDPTEGLQVRKSRRVRPVTLTEDELQRLLIAAVFELGERQAWALLLVYLLGLRRIEAAGLRWEDVRDGESGPVIEIRTTKGANERDPLPLTPVALECLARLRELPAPPQAMLDERFILRARRATVSDWAHRAGVAAGLHPHKVGAHRLRATLGTRLLHSGVDVRTVQKTLGHLRLESTAWYLEESGEAEVRDALTRIRP